MNFFITLIFAVLSVSIQASSSSSSSYSCETSLSSDSSSGCDISSSCEGTYLSSEASPRVCRKELENIESQVCSPAVNYFKSLEAQVRANARAWFASTTRTETAKSFAVQNGIILKIYSAFGNSIEFPSVTNQGPSNGFTILRAQALNKGVFDIGMSGTDAYYAFQMFAAEGGYMLVQFIVARSKLPLNNIAYKRKCLYN